MGLPSYVPQPSREVIELYEQVDIENHSVRNVAWRDLTGDGLDDVVALDLTTSSLIQGDGTLVITAYEGSSGKQLWVAKEAFEDGSVFPYQARVGPSGRNGVLLIKAEGSDASFIGISNKGKRAYETTVKISSWDSPDQQGNYSELISVGFFDSFPGRATEVLLGEAFGQGALVDGSAYVRANTAVRTMVLDGRSGEVVTNDAMDRGWQQRPLPQVGPDIDGNGLDDYLVLNVEPELGQDPETGLPVLPDPNSRYARARDGRAGTSIWVSEPLPFSQSEPVFNLASAGSFVDLLADRSLGDLTDDGVGDVIVATNRFAPFDDEQTIDDFPFFMIDGAGGDLLWTAHGELSGAPFVQVREAGRIDGDYIPDVLTVTFEWTSEDVVTRVIAYSGLTGEPIFRRSFPMPGATPPTGDDGAGGWGSSFEFLFGDIQGDGASEWLVSSGWFNESGSDVPRDSFYLDGRTGRTLGSDPDGYALLGAVDGRDDDLFRVSAFPVESRLEVLDGRTNSRLLSVTAATPLTEAAAYWTGVGIADLNGDRCRDVVGTIADGQGVFALMIDGASGRIIWTRRQAGRDVGDATLAKRTDSNRAC
jgi:hypothetical protein